MKKLKTKIVKNSLSITIALFGIIYSNTTSHTYDNKQRHKVISRNLNHISCIESNCGKNKKHRIVNHGLNAGDRAAGSYGLMPITTKEIINKNPKLSIKYGHIAKLPHDKINKIINLNDNIDKEIASAHWDRLGKAFPKDEIRRVYAWKNGITGAKRASALKINSDPYVKKFKRLKYIEISSN
jgi:hypothetical protein